MDQAPGFWEKKKKTWKTCAMFSWGGEGMKPFLSTNSSQTGSSDDSCLVCIFHTQKGKKMVEMLQIHQEFFRGDPGILVWVPRSGFQWWLNPQRLLP